MIPIAKPLISDEEKRAVVEVLDSGMIASGSVVREFEKEFAAYIGTDACVTTTSGTTALEVGLRALGIGPGDKVLTTPFSFIASTNAIIYTGAEPVFGDVGRRTFNLTADSIERALKEDPSIRTVLIVHLFGQPCNMDKIMPVVEKYDLTLVEDCAQAHGAQWNGKMIGTFGKTGCFSFYPTKNMTTGEGGAIVTSDPDVAKNCSLLINHGMEVRYHHDRIGYNYRMTNLAAAIGRCQLKKLDEFNRIRIETAELYNREITNPLVEVPHVLPCAKHVFHQYTVKVSGGRREDFIEHLTENGVGHGIFYPLTIPEQKCYEGRNFASGSGVADILKNQVVSIPVHPSLSEADKETVVRVINDYK